MTLPPLILASSSVYRQQQLSQLNIDFEAYSPDIDETPTADEIPEELALRLAVSKAQKAHAEFTDAVVIGSDQVCSQGHVTYGKPGSKENAIAQLLKFVGKQVVFNTALAVIDPKGRQYHHVDRTVVKFRSLTRSEIERYVQQDQPMDCAGGFKVESLGLALFESIQTTDPSALVGLPLITTAQFLREVGYAIP